MDLLLVFLTSAVLTIIFKEVFTRIDGNLYTKIRGGTPRAVGMAPYLALLIFFPSPGKYLIALMGIFAFLDDILGRKKILELPLEFGQLSRGIGMLLVMVIGYIYYGPVAILIGLMIQPLNISDMQPGSACSTIIIMGVVVILSIFALTSTIYFPILILLAACIGYAPLDYKGKIMMGEVGNHAFAIGLGVIYAYFGFELSSKIGGGGYTIFFTTLILLIITSILIAFIRRRSLHIYLENVLNIEKPRFGDLIMDVLTGGGMGDLVRRFLLGKRVVTIENTRLILLGFRRLVHNPASKNIQ